MVAALPIVREAVPFLTMEPVPLVRPASVIATLFVPSVRTTPAPSRVSVPLLAIELRVSLPCSLIVAPEEMLMPEVFARMPALVVTSVPAVTVVRPA